MCYNFDPSLSVLDSPLSAEDLIRACATSSTSAHWLEFMRRFNDDIVTAVYRAARRWRDINPDTLQELVQDTYLKICDPDRNNLARFRSRGPGSAVAFIRVVATNLVIDHFKSLHTQRHGGGLKPASEEEREQLVSPDGTAGSASMIEREVLLGEIDKYLQIALQGPTSERDRRIFWYYYRHGMTAQEIADLPSTALSFKGVESALLRLTRLVREYLAAHRLAEHRKKRDDISGSGLRIAGSL